LGHERLHPTLYFRPEKEKGRGFPENRVTTREQCTPAAIGPQSREGCSRAR
jgi:hypothetical protein